MKRISLRKKILITFSCLLVGLITTFVVLNYIPSNHTQEVGTTVLTARKVDYKTKDKKPTYTETLNENNKWLDQLDKRLAEQDASKAKSAEAAKKKSNKDKADKITKSVGKSLALIIKNAKKEPDPEVYLKAVEGIITGVAGAFGYGGVAEAGVEILNAFIELSKTGENPLSEVAVLSDHMDGQFAEVNEKLDVLLENLDSYANEMDSKLDLVVSRIAEKIEITSEAQDINNFYNSKLFSYSKLKNNLYGSFDASVNVNNSTAYYNILRKTAITNPTQVDALYEILFTSLLDSMEEFEYFLKGDSSVINKAIIKKYYDIVSSQYNQGLVPSGSTPVSVALEFAMDLYNTYDFACDVLAECYAYYIQKTYYNAALVSNTDRELENQLSKIQFFGKHQFNYEMLVGNLNNIENRKDSLNNYLVDDLAYILGLGTSYNSLDAKNNAYDNYVNQLNNVSYINMDYNQTVNTNLINSQINKMFGLQDENYKYFIGYDGMSQETEVTGEKMGEVTYAQLSNLTNPYVKYTYNGKVLYKLYFKFNPVDTFLAGDGTYDHPYLISNVSQFDYFMKNPEMNACYKLVSDITLSSDAIYTPIGDINHEFNGILDGNGYKVENLTIQGNNQGELDTYTAGIFGSLGSYGQVLNLTLENLSVNSNFEQDGIQLAREDVSFVVGGITGINKGTINNCKIISTLNDKGITVNRDKSEKNSRNITLFVGGIAGKSYAPINSVIVDGLKINVISKLKSHAQDDNKNMNTAYIGGIVGSSNGSMYRAMARDIDFNVEIATTASEDNTKFPYAKAYVGGLVGDTESNLPNIRECYSNVNVNKPKVTISNTGNPGWGKAKYGEDNREYLVGRYYPCTVLIDNDSWLDTDELNANLELYCILDRIYRNEYCGCTDYSLEDDCKKFADDLEKIGHIEFNKNDEPGYMHKILKKHLLNKLEDMYAEFRQQTNSYSDYNPSEFNNNVNSNIKIEPKEEGFMYENGQTFNPSDFNFFVNGQLVDASVVAYYGANTINTTSTATLSDVTVYFIATIDGVSKLFKGVLNVTNAPDTIVYSEIIINTSHIYKGTSDEDVLLKIAKDGFVINHYYSSGKIIKVSSNSKNDLGISSIDGEMIAAHLGKRKVSFYDARNHISFKGEINISCAHMHYAEDVHEAHCSQWGYTEVTCLDEECGCIFYRDFIFGEHEFEEFREEATCTHEGREPYHVCKYCGVQYGGDSIPMLPHNFIDSDDNYHYCDANHDGVINLDNGDHREEHQFVLYEEYDEEGRVVYRYKCVAEGCGYEKVETDSNIITYNQTKMPTVFVTNGYYLAEGDIVVVHVELLNNLGFNNAKFGIRYTEGLLLKDYDISETMLPNLETKRVVRVSNGLDINYITADDKVIATDKSLLTLYFQVTNSTKDQKVSVTYGLEDEGGFWIGGPFESIKRYLTYDGIIKKVVHLPGDVDGNKIVDSIDADYVTEMSQLTGENRIWADVNLNGKPDAQDFSAIEEARKGTYGRSLVYPIYDLYLNYGYNRLVKQKTINYYGIDLETGKLPNEIIIPTWQDVLDYQELNPSREGYTFLGWYDRHEGGNLIIAPNSESTEKVKYFMDQVQQTLYAQWARNTVKYYLEDGSCVEESYKLDDDNEHSLLTLDDKYYTIQFIVDGKEYSSEKASRKFVGWQDKNNPNVVYYVNNDFTFDLNVANFCKNGVLELIPVWKDIEEIPMPEETEFGKENIEIWFYRLNGETHKYSSTTLPKLIDAALSSDKIIRLTGEYKYTEFYIEYDGEVDAKATKTFQMNNLDGCKLATEYYPTDTSKSWTDNLRLENGNIVRSFDEIVEYLKNSNDRSKKIIRIYGETIPNLIEVKLTKNSSTEVNWSISGGDYAELKYEIIYSGTRDTGTVKGSKGTIKLSSTMNYAYAHAIVRIIEVKVKSEYNGLYVTKYKAESIQVDKLFGGGTGTSSNPYIISNSDQFKNLYNFMEYSGTYNLYEYKICNACFKLTTNLVIGGSFTVLPTLYNCTFDGNGHTITISGSISNTYSAGLTGLFSRLRNSTVKNLTVDYTSSSCNGTVLSFGGIAARSYDSQIEGCNIRGTLRNFNLESVAGGIAGELNGGKVYGCYGGINFYTKGTAGGVVGRLTNNGEVSGCYYTGIIYITYNGGSCIPCVGGIVGEMSNGTVHDVVLQTYYSSYCIVNDGNTYDSNKVKLGKFVGNKKGGNLYGTGIITGGNIKIPTSAPSTPVPSTCH